MANTINNLQNNTTLRPRRLPRHTQLHNPHLLGSPSRPTHNLLQIERDPPAHKLVDLGPRLPPNLLRAHSIRHAKRPSTGEQKPLDVLVHSHYRR